MIVFFFLDKTIICFQIEQILNSFKKKEVIMTTLAMNNAYKE